MINLYIENKKPVAEINVYGFVDFVNTVVSIYDSHSIDHFHISYDARGWSSLYAVIENKNEKFTVYTGFIECDDEDYTNYLHELMSTYFDTINNAKNKEVRHTALKSFACSVIDYYGD